MAKAIRERHDNTAEIQLFDTGSLSSQSRTSTEKGFVKGLHRQGFAFLVVNAIVFLLLTTHGFTQVSPTHPEKPELHFQSFESLREHQRKFGLQECTIDFECQLVFAARDWTACFVETAEHATMLHCKQEHSNELRTLTAGARLAVSGKLTRESNFIHVSSLAVIDRDARIKPLDLSVVTHGTATRLNGLALFTGGVREIMIDFGVVYLFTWSGYVPYEVELHGAELNEATAKAMWNQMVKVTGSLTRIHQEQEALYSIRAMGKDQIISPDPEKAPGALQPDFRALHGQVQYSDNRSTVLVEIEERIYQVRTRFAHRIRAGDMIEIDQPSSKLAPKVSEPIVPSIIVRKGNRALPTSMTVTSSGLQSGELASRITVRAVVRESRKLSRANGTLTLECDGVSFAAVIPTNDDIVDLPGYRPGDFVEVTGCAFFAPSPSRQVDKPYRALTLYAAAPTDLRFIRGPWRVSPWMMLYMALVIAGLFLLATLWNRMLRREVCSRTAELGVATTHLRKSYEAIPKAVLVHGEDYRITGTNAKFQQIFGTMPIDGQNALDVLTYVSKNFGDPDAFQFFIANATESPHNPVAERLNLLSSNRILDAFSSPIIDDAGIRYGRLWAFEDVTEKLRMETELLEAQKSAIVEQLAGGIAHDFNNLLAVIRSSLTVARMNHSHIPRSLGIAELAVDQASDLTCRLLDFSRRTELTCRVCDVNVLLQQVYCLARHSVGGNIDVSLKPLPKSVFINVDVNRIEQVLLNICLNARDSINKKPGRITIFAQPMDDQDGNRKVSLCVEDNGVGMPEEVRSRVYEAFFTTKQIGKGIGLGLAMAKSVVEQLGGNIECQSIVNSGTTFKITFPIVSESVSETWRQTDSLESAPSSSNILIVDDDALVRKSSKAMLESSGHHVVTAENGEEALLVLDAFPNFDAVVLDFAMPGRNGVEIFYEIRQRFPRLPVAICSGYNLNFGVDFSSSEAADLPHFLAKPLRFSDFSMFLESGQRSSDVEYTK